MIGGIVAIIGWIGVLVDLAGFEPFNLFEAMRMTLNAIVGVFTWTLMLAATPHISNPPNGPVHPRRRTQGSQAPASLVDARTTGAAAPLTWVRYQLRGIAALLGAALAFRLPKKKLEADASVEETVKEIVRNPSIPGLQLEMEDFRPNIETVAVTPWRLVSSPSLVLQLSMT